MRGERLGVVALEEAEVVELVVNGAAEERARRHAERAAERVPAGDLDPGEDDLRELRPHLPAAFAPDRAQDRLHVAGRATDDLARHQLAVRDDRARVLADRLAVADDAVVGVDGEEHEVRAELRAAGPVELLRQRDRERRRLDARDLHCELLQPEDGDGRLAALERRDDLALALLDRACGGEHVVGVGGRDDRDAVRVGADEVARGDRDAAQRDRHAQRSRPGLARPARRGAEVEDRHADRLELRAVADRAVDHDPGDAPLARGERDDVAAVRGSGLAADREHDHVARVRGRDGVVQREVVARARPAR